MKGNSILAIARDARKCAVGHRGLHSHKWLGHEPVVAAEGQVTVTDSVQAVLLQWSIMVLWVAAH